MTSSPEFISLVQQMKALIREESLAAMGGEIQQGGIEGMSLDVGPEGIEKVF
jgi:NitT/TauT family transport system ATP-binding protein